MLLYRAQSVPSGLRLRAPAGNDPASRIAGRWFTDDLEAAYGFLSSIDGPSQIVCVEIADDIAATFRVSAAPVTACGLRPGDFSGSPDSDYVIPRFFAVQAEEVEAVAADGSGQVVTVDFTPASVEIGRVATSDGDVVLSACPSGALTLACETTGLSLSFDDEAAARMGGMLTQASAPDAGRLVA